MAGSDAWTRDNILCSQQGQPLLYLTTEAMAVCIGAVHVDKYI